MAAATSTLKLVLDDKEYESNIKSAKQGMVDLQQSLVSAGKTFANVDKQVVDYAKAIGNMGTVSKTAKGKLGELTQTFTELSVQYKNLTDQEKNSPFGKALAESIDTLKNRTRELKEQLNDVSSSLQSTPSASVTPTTVDPFGNLTSKFTKANLYAMAAEKGVEAMQQLGRHIADVMKEAQKLSMESDGIRAAFERLNQPGLLNNLKEATHGTVSELELMKAAVKFDDFKLPVEELGTLLAFAQKKAKDTGQSVDYMVDSIVTGLGRKSLMILDNLGLSAAQIKDKMKESGDMTKAVAEIIREEMAKSGEYVETASDRMARGIADNQNAMIKLGDAMREAFGDTGLEEVVSILEGKLIADLTDLVGVAGQVKDIFNDILGTDSGLADIASTIYDIGKELYFVLNPLMEIYRIYQKLNPEKFGVLGGAIGNIATGKTVVNPVVGSGNGGGGGSRSSAKQTFAPDSIAAMEQHVNNLTKKWREAGENVRDLYLVQLQEAKKVLAEMNGTALPTGSMAELNQQISQLRTEQSKVTNTEEWQKYNEQIRKITDRVEVLKGKMGAIAVGGLAKVSGETFSQDASSAVYQERKALEGATLDTSAIDNIKKGGKDVADSWRTAASAVSSFGTVLNSIEDPAAKVAATVAQAIASIAMAYSEALAKDKTSKSNIWLFIASAAAATASMVSTISQIHSSTGYAEGGVIPGTHFSGDMQWARVNAGETILNTAQTGIIANALENSSSNFHLETSLDVEKIRIALVRNGRRRGKTESVNFA